MLSQGHLLIGQSLDSHGRSRVGHAMRLRKARIILVSECQVLVVW